MAAIDDSPVRHRRGFWRQSEVQGFEGEATTLVVGGSPGPHAPGISSGSRSALVPLLTRVIQDNSSPAVSDAGLEALARPAFAFPSFVRRQVSTPLACFSEFLAAPAHAGAAPISLRMGRCECANAYCK